MPTSDPIRYPYPLGTIEGQRQAAVRARHDLTETIAELAERLGRAGRLRRRTRVSVLAAAAGGLGSLTVQLLGLRTRRGSIPVALIVAGTSGWAAWRVMSRDATTWRAHRTGHELAGSAGGDVVDLLVAQHRQISRAFDAVLQAEGAGRTESFARLVTLLTQHEHAEQNIVHPLLTDAELARRCLADERQVERALASLIAAGVHSPGFVEGLVRSRDQVTVHMRREEEQEFPHLRATTSSELLSRATNAVQAAQAGEAWTLG
jgi:hypothetical protein